MVKSLNGHLSGKDIKIVTLNALSFFPFAANKENWLANMGNYIAQSSPDDVKGVGMAHPVVNSVPQAAYRQEKVVLDDQETAAVAWKVAAVENEITAAGHTLPPDYNKFLSSQFALVKHADLRGIVVHQHAHHVEANKPLPFCRCPEPVPNKKHKSRDLTL